jgi:hypothetical protein
MKARDFDTFMSVVGAFTTLTLIVFKTHLGITSEDCLIGGAVVAGCTKFIAISRVAEILKGPK